MNYLDESFSYERFMADEWSSGGNAEELEILYKIVLTIIDNELTDSQRKCMIEYFIDDKNMVEIAKEMGVNISVVSRHISKSKKTILKLLKYSQVVDKYVQTKCKNN